MKRKCRKLRPNKKGFNTAIYIDSDEREEILAYIGQDRRHIDKFIDIAKVILEELNNRHLFKLEKVEGTKDIWAMRFFVGQENDRIYCKRMTAADGVKWVIMGKLHLKKKNKKLNSEQKNIIKKLHSYEYEEESW